MQQASELSPAIDLALAELRCIGNALVVPDHDDNGVVACQSEPPSKHKFGTARC